MSADLTTQVQALDDVLAAFEARLEAATALDLTVLRLVNPRAAAPSTQVARAVHVGSPRSVNTLETRQQGFTVANDTIVVTLFTQLNPADQVALGRTPALQLEDAVRELLTARSWGRTWCVTWLSTSRGPGQASNAWWVCEQTFSIRRNAAVGGL